MTTTPSTAPAHTAKDGKGILITEPAMQQLAKLCADQGEDRVLRVGVRSGGCSAPCKLHLRGSTRWLAAPLPQRVSHHMAQSERT